MPRTSRPLSRSEQAASIARSGVGNRKTLTPDSALYRTCQGIPRQSECDADKLQLSESTHAVPRGLSAQILAPFTFPSPVSNPRRHCWRSAWIIREARARASTLSPVSSPLAFVTCRVYGGLRWGGRDPTSITIAGKRVVSYEYQGVSTPVAKSKVTPKRVTYISNGTTVTLTKTSNTTAFAALHSSQGDATAELTKL